MVLICFLQQGPSSSCCCWQKENRFWRPRLQSTWGLALARHAFFPPHPAMPGRFTPSGLVGGETEMLRLPQLPRTDPDSAAALRSRPATRLKAHASCSKHKCVNNNSRVERIQRGDYIEWISLENLSRVDITLVIVKRDTTRKVL